MGFWLTALVTLAADQLSKWLVQLYMQEGQTIPLLPRVFHLTYVRNPGAAFGILAYQTGFFIGVALLVVLGVIWASRRLTEDRFLTRLSLGLVMGGALGNLVDRLRYGLVVDFLDFRIWPVFNLADTAIVVGTFFLLLALWREEAGRSGKD
ncbi:signal peptidase II [Desulfovirgula thermocuniculi]|uniref:signal peptidase II n=1 Tax=Desulfovirgula thermocuniculi TaxID=348842 RepID=UPI000405E324|nr:signal peptidase II [Desulfovirgula thermocuniculi]